MSTSYKLVRVTAQPRRFRWLTLLLGKRIDEKTVFVPSSVDIERNLNQPDRVTIR